MFAKSNWWYTFFPPGNLVCLVFWGTHVGYYCPKWYIFLKECCILEVLHYHQFYGVHEALPIWLPKRQSNSWCFMVWEVIVITSELSFRRECKNFLYKFVSLFIHLSLIIYTVLSDFCVVDIIEKTCLYFYTSGRNAINILCIKS